MNFKELVESDIDTVFFNEEEFSETHSIDGKTVRAIIDNLELNERNKGKKGTYSDSLYINEILIYIPKIDLQIKPRVNKIIILDGKNRYKITDVIEENGVYSVTCEIYKV